MCDDGVATVTTRKVCFFVDRPKATQQDAISAHRPPDVLKHFIAFRSLKMPCKWLSLTLQRCDTQSSFDIASYILWKNAPSCYRNWNTHNSFLYLSMQQLFCIFHPVDFDCGWPNGRMARNEGWARESSAWTKICCFFCIQKFSKNLHPNALWTDERCTEMFVLYVIQSHA